MLRPAMPASKEFFSRDRQMTWQNGADLALGALKSLRQTLLERERHLESLYAAAADKSCRRFGVQCICADPDARSIALGLEENLDDVRGQLDELSDRIGQLLKHGGDKAEGEASEQLKLIGWRYNLSEY